MSGTVAPRIGRHFEETVAYAFVGWQLAAMNWLSKRAVALRLGVARPTLDKMLVQGHFPQGTPIADSRRWPAPLVDEWLRRQATLPEPVERQPEAREVG